MTDVKTLISRAQAGDDQAFADLMRTHYAFVYAIVIGIVDNPQDTEEIVQDVFVNTYRGLAQYEERTKFRSWLAKIARNRALNWTRDQRIENVSINELHEHKLQTPDALADQLIRTEQRALIRGAMESLSPKDRKIARSYYLDGASYDELIRTHGLSYKAISVRLSRAKRKLSKRLRHLLTGVFVSPTATLKQVYSGGLTVMKVGTVTKVTVGAAAIIGLSFIGTHHFISSKEDSSTSVEIITSTSVPRKKSTRKRVVTAPRIANEPQISAEEMEQIESFFAQLDEPGTQENVEMLDEQFVVDIDDKKQEIHEEQEPIDKPSKKPDMTAEQIETKLEILYEEIAQNLEERIELQRIVNELAPDYGYDPELDALRDWADEEARKLRFTISDMIFDYAILSRDDTPFSPGGEFYSLLQAADMHISINLYQK